jgi:hypothetical protein
MAGTWTKRRAGAALVAFIAAVSSAVVCGREPRAATAPTDAPFFFVSALGKCMDASAAITDEHAPIVVARCTQAGGQNAEIVSVRVRRHRRGRPPARAYMEGIIVCTSASARLVDLASRFSSTNCVRRRNYRSKVRRQQIGYSRGGKI